MKISFSPTSIKDFVIDHTEKVILICVVSSLLFVAWSAFGHQVLKIRPEGIMEKAGKAREILANSKAPELQTSQMSIWPQRRKKQIDKDTYVQDKPFNPKLFPEKQDDSDPALLAILRLQGRAVVGPMAVKGPGVGQPDPKDAIRKPLEPGTYGGVRGDYGYEGRRMIVLTGLVPYQDQVAEFRRAFSGKAPRNRPEQNEPVYTVFRIERREIAPDGTGEWDLGHVPWVSRNFAKPPQVRNLGAVFQDWAPTAPPVVAPRYRDPLLTMPLPPMMLTDWGEEATHPEIPLARAETRAVPAPAPKIDRPTPTPEKFDPTAPLAVDDMRATTRKVSTVVARAATDREDAAGAEIPVRQALPRYKLFRFIDFGVKPNHKYQYRVVAYMHNPNYGIPAKFLANDKQPRMKLLPMSKESPLIAVPSDHRILGGSVAMAENNGPNSNGGPVSEVMVVQWRNDLGSDIISKYRGDALGALLDEPISQFRIDPRTQPAYVSIPKQAAGPQDASSSVLVVGARGGTPISGKMQGKVAPGETILLTPDGNLIVKRQTDDALMYQQRSVNEVPAAKDKPKKDPKKPDKGVGVGVVRKGGDPRPATGVPLDE